MRRHAHWSTLGTFPSSGRRRLAWAAVALLAVAAVAALETAWGQVATTAETVATQPTTTTTATTAPALEPPEKKYGAWVLVPPIATIILAIALRQVIPALSIGVLVAAFMLVPCLAPQDAYGGGVIGGLRLAIETYLVNALTDTDHIKIIVFTFSIGGMIGIIAANGGTGAVVNAVARWASNRRRGQITTWLAGLVVFFDDYANAMIVGPSMRPICDRLRISRAKLAYIVDSTAAPVSSIVPIGTWVGAEIGFIRDGLDQLKNTPA
ncbi:MAG TPA: Na+/H+ antiporter NhaC family protein, partial [Phycisphaerae bacterium]|nr:Na+/H+ antiporter NhaC family protein [Phycisphaerae bacterium]